MNNPKGHAFESFHNETEKKMLEFKKKVYGE